MRSCALAALAYCQDAGPGLRHIAVVFLDAHSDVVYRHLVAAVLDDFDGDGLSDQCRATEATTGYGHFGQAVKITGVASDGANHRVPGIDVYRVVGAAVFAISDIEGKIINLTYIVGLG